MPRKYTRRQVLRTGAVIGASIGVTSVAKMQDATPEATPESTPQAAAGLPIDMGKSAAEQDLAIALDGEGSDGIIRAAGGVEARVEAAIRIQTGDACDADAILYRFARGHEHDDFAIGLQGNPVDAFNTIGPKGNKRFPSAAKRCGRAK